MRQLAKTLGLLVTLGAVIPFGSSGCLLPLGDCRKDPSFDVCAQPSQSGSELCRSGGCPSINDENECRAQPHCYWQQGMT